MQSLGIQKEIRDLSYVEKRLLIVISLTQQLRNAEADLSRTIESTANQLKVMQQQISRLKIAVGDFLNIFASKLIPYMNGFLMALVEVVKYITKFVKELLGIKDVEIDYSNLAGTGDNEYIDELIDGLEEANDEAEKLKKNLIGIDELNILQPQEDEDNNGMDIDPAILNAFTASLEDWDNKMDETEMKAYKIRDAILSWIGLKPDGDGWGLATAESIMGRILETVKNIVEWWKKVDLKDFLNNLKRAWDILSWIAGLLLSLKFPLLAGLFKLIEGILEIGQRGADLENILDIIQGIGWVLFWIGSILGAKPFAGIGLILVGLTRLIDDVNKALEDGHIDLVELAKILTDIALVVIGLALVGQLKTVTGWLMACITWVWNFARALVLSLAGSSAARSALFFLIEQLKAVIATLMTIFAWVSIVAGAFGFFKTIHDLINGTITPLQGFLRILKYIGLVLMGIMILLGRWAAALAAGAVFVVAGIADANLTKKINAEKSDTSNDKQDSNSSNITKQLDDIQKQINSSVGINTSVSTTPNGGYNISDFSTIGTSGINTQSTTNSSSMSNISSNVSEILSTVRSIASDTSNINNKDFSLNIDSRDIARANNTGTQKIGSSQLGGVFANV